MQFVSNFFRSALAEHEASFFCLRQAGKIPRFNIKN